MIGQIHVPKQRGVLSRLEKFFGSNTRTISRKLYLNIFRTKNGKIRKKKKLREKSMESACKTSSAIKLNSLLLVPRRLWFHGHRTVWNVDVFFLMKYLLFRRWYAGSSCDNRQTSFSSNTSAIRQYYSVHERFDTLELMHPRRLPAGALRIHFENFFLVRFPRSAAGAASRPASSQSAPSTAAAIGRRTNKTITRYPFPSWKPWLFQVGLVTLCSKSSELVHPGYPSGTSPTFFRGTRWWSKLAAIIFLGPCWRCPWSSWSSRLKLVSVRTGSNVVSELSVCLLPYPCDRSFASIVAFLYPSCLSPPKFFFFCHTW